MFVPLLPPNLGPNVICYEQLFSSQEFDYIEIKVVFFHFCCVCGRLFSQLRNFWKKVFMNTKSTAFIYHFLTWRSFSRVFYIQKYAHQILRINSYRKFKLSRIPGKDQSYELYCISAVTFLFLYYRKRHLVGGSYHRE